MAATTASRSGAAGVALKRLRAAGMALIPPPPLLPPQYCDQLIGPQGVLLSLASVSTPNLHVRRTAVQCIGYLCSGTMAAAKGDK